MPGQHLNTISVWALIAGNAYITPCCSVRAQNLMTKIYHRTFFMHFFRLNCKVTFTFVWMNSVYSAVYPLQSTKNVQIILQQQLKLTISNTNNESIKLLIFCRIERICKKIGQWNIILWRKIVLFILLATADSWRYFFTIPTRRLPATEISLGFRHSI